MAVYVIGDVQGCYRELRKLLKSVGFKSDKDRLWFAGDLVNRGADSLKTLRFVKELGDQAITVLGNHDLHLLAAFYTGTKLRSNDTLDDTLTAPDSESLMQWLRFRPLLHHDVDLNFTMVHAGIYPGWSISDSALRAREVEAQLQGDQYLQFFHNMYGNKPSVWSDDLTGMERLRFITNVFTRMRYLQPDLSLDLTAKGRPEKVKKENARPWFEFRQSAIKFNRVVFGHWSTLPSDQYGNCFAIDSGCIWGGRLTALRIDKKTPRWFSLSCDESAVAGSD
jgi:bis(5'-nucleosyl)-tetraphosphatase (symmetrical)